MDDHTPEVAAIGSPSAAIIPPTGYDAAPFRTAPPVLAGASSSAAATTIVALDVSPSIAGRAIEATGRSSPAPHGAALPASWCPLAVPVVVPEHLASRSTKVRGAISAVTVSVIAGTNSTSHAKGLVAVNGLIGLCTRKEPLPASIALCLEGYSSCGAQL